jgi:AcrR family transcriptional regulator
MEHVTRVSRAESSARTRQRVLAEAERLFRERGYAATSIEQIAEAADVTKGAVYGHFSSKEDVLLSALEGAPTPDFVTALNDTSLPLEERLAAFGRAIAVDEVVSDKSGLAVTLEFIAAVLRSPVATARFRATVTHQLEELAAHDDDEPRPGISKVESWTIGYALFIGLQIYHCVSPELVSPSVFEHAYTSLASLYPEQ